MKSISFFSVVALLFLWACTPKQTKEIKQEIAVRALPSIIEIVGNDTILNPDKLIRICNEINISDSALYTWKNRIIIYSVTGNAEEVMRRITSGYADATVKLYERPYYEFNRSRCDNKETSERWSHTIMTANLVSDSTLQKEYMNYHATQFENWPEISKGFCNADFQQLLMFRNDRQLMLVISIPDGEDLDELNPKTMENNPRVDEWNALMAKYQERVEGAAPGETWVVFNPVNK